MGINNFYLLFFGLTALVCSNAMAEIKAKDLGNGWLALTEQADPFDKNAIKIIEITKDDFTFQCGELNMSASSYGFESLSFNAELKYLIDSNPAKSKTGTYSTYLGGSDLVTDSRYYSFNLNTEDIAAMKSGSSMKVAGRYGSSGWETKNINLAGFTSAYSLMCGK